MDTTAMHSLSPELLAANDGWLRALVRRLVDDGQTDDVLQEVWGHAMRTPPRDQKALPAWLATVARRVAGKAARSARRRRKHEQDAAQARRDDAVDPAQLVARVEERQRVAQTVLELDEPFRTVVLLRYFEDLTPEQIAERLDIPGATVRSRLHRGHEKLRARFERERGAGWRGELALLCVPLGEGAPLAPAAKLQVSAWLGIVPLAVAAFVWWFVASQTATPTPSPTAPAKNASAAVTAEPAVTGEATQDNSNRTATEVVDQPVAVADTTNRVQGICLDPNGQPLAGVPLAFVKAALLQRDADLQVPVEVGTTGANGQFDVRVPQDDGTVRAVGTFATLREWELRRAQSETADALVVATHRVQLSGHVVTKDGAPVADNEVAVAIMDTYGLPVAAAGTRLRRRDIRTKTDANGHFELADVPAFRFGDLRVGFNKAIVPIPLVDRNDLRIVMGTGRISVARAKQPNQPATPRAERFAIVGTVTSGEQPLADALVRARRTDNAVTTDARGTFRVEGSALPNQPAVIWVAAQDHQPQRVEVFRDTSREATPLRVELRQVADGDPAMTGTVIDADKRPIAGITVMLADATPLASTSFAFRYVESVQPNQLGAHTTTDDEGHFRIPNVLDRPYRVRVLDTTTGYAQTFGPFDPRQPCELRVPNRRQSREHIVRIVDKFDRPVSGASVALSVVQLHIESDSPYFHGWSTSFFGDSHKSSSDRDGFCHFANTPNGDLRITVTKPGWVNQELDLVAGQEHPAHQNGVTTIRMHQLLPIRVATAGLDDRYLTLKLFDATGKELEVKPAWRGDVYPSRHQWGFVRGHSVVGAVSDSACHAELHDLFRNELLRQMPVVFATGGVTVLDFPE